MHVLIGFVLIIGVIAFGFGANIARMTVRACIAGALLAFVVATMYIAVEVWQTPDADIVESAKIPEDTPELRRLCTEWKTHPDDAPRMCFGVLE